jgi:hypothetical protein
MYYQAHKQKDKPTSLLAPTTKPVGMKNKNAKYYDFEPSKAP